MKREKVKADPETVKKAAVMKLMDELATRRAEFKKNKWLCLSTEFHFPPSATPWFASASIPMWRNFRTLDSSREFYGWPK